MSALLRSLHELLAEMARAYGGRPEEAAVRSLVARLDEPLRVALAGRVKAGKSTLLNALVGERLAATDAGECTRIVTWYTHGLASRAWAHPRTGAPRQVPFHRIDGQTVLELGELHADDVERLVVEVPSARLERLTLIDTPGIGSLSTDVSARTDAAMRADDGPPVADAVLYLMRHLHASDVGFLESFHGEPVTGATPVNAIGVLSRADEIGAGRTDAMEQAGRIAAAYRTDRRVRGLVQTVLPVAGLLGQAATALRQRDFAALDAIARSGAAGDALMLTADRFGAESLDAPVDASARRELLSAMGLSGVRLSVALLRSGLVRSSPELATELRRRSGLDELRDALLTQFTERSALLKAQAALHAVDRILADAPLVHAARLRARLEAVVGSAHELTELRLLNDLRTGELQLPDDDTRDEAEALLGVAGTDARSRLRLPPTAIDAEVRAALLAALRHWQRRAASPLSGTAVRQVADVLRRSCEGLLAATRVAQG